jgi:hypothetical protein
MPRLLSPAAGEHMELPAYYADFLENYSRTHEFWKLERGQVYAEPGNESWEAFDRGDWEESLRLLEMSREGLASYFREAKGRGTVGRRIRIAALPPSAYLQWELHVLRVRDELGEPIHVLLDTEVAALEDQEPLPDIYTMDSDIMYQAVYDASGVLQHAVKYTDRDLVHSCHRLIADLYGQGEPIGEFFHREISPLPPPRPGTHAIPHDYLERTGRPRPPRT